jgi:antitoxin ParD1/3/4
MVLGKKCHRCYVRYDTEGIPMTTMNISLPDEMRAFIEAQIAQEGFASASEYLRSLVRDAQKRKVRLELEAKILEGLQGPSVEMTREDWESIRAEALEGLAGEAIQP